ncbi:hypothetical protein USDA257_c06410 [Sinorhizobium fredii USDA 257]|uniref:Uncharacterized protein n=1 Tax=Sinorhizobium fredii (strain USDA 257) TaxID=1185652 RepID=I3X030_SINF2|nr:hypothetical protein USDA257_c06410 [Sinorhizobium fredii USDA 257]
MSFKGEPPPGHLFVPVRQKSRGHSCHHGKFPNISEIWACGARPVDFSNCRCYRRCPRAEKGLHRSSVWRRRGLRMGSCSGHGRDRDSFGLTRRSCCGLKASPVQ